MYELTFMHCNACGEGGLVDSWERDFDWVVEIDVAADATEVPSHVSPLGPGMGLHDRAPATSEAPETEPPPAARDRIVWPVLAPDDIATLWALRVPLEAACVPEDELRRALAERRVRCTVTASSMGTAETYWTVVRSPERLAHVRHDGVVLPPGEIATETPVEDWADDRDVERVLWIPFFEAQRTTFVRAIPRALHQSLIAEYAALLVDLERRWASGPKSIARAPLLDWLCAEGPIDVDELARVIDEHGRRSVRHLVQGLRSRWVTHDLEAAFGAVMASAQRFEDGTVRATRAALLACGARAVRER